MASYSDFIDTINDRLFFILNTGDNDDRSVKFNPTLINGVQRDLLNLNNDKSPPLLFYLRKVPNQSNPLLFNLVVKYKDGQNHLVGIFVDQAGGQFLGISNDFKTVAFFPIVLDNIQLVTFQDALTGKDLRVDVNGFLRFDVGTSIRLGFDAAVPFIEFDEAETWAAIAPFLLNGNTQGYTDAITLARLTLSGMIIFGIIGGIAFFDISASIIVSIPDIALSLLVRIGGLMLAKGVLPP